MPINIGNFSLSSNRSTPHTPPLYSHCQMRPKGGNIFHLSSPIRIGSYRFPLALHRSPASESAAAVAVAAVAAAAPLPSGAASFPCSSAIAEGQMPENVTEALISADSRQRNSYGATTSGAATADATGENRLEPLSTAPSAGDSASAAAAGASAPDAAALTPVRRPASMAAEFAPGISFLEDAPPPYNPGYDLSSTTIATIEPHGPLDETALAAAAAVAAANMTLSEALHECGICMVNTKDCAFDCGHLACSECAEMLVECHICREKIAGKRKIYL